MTTRTALDVLVTHAALGHMVDGDLMNLLGDEVLSSPEFSAQIKNVCAKVSAQLSDEIDSICGFLGISKRKFLEAAFIEAVDKAKAIIDAEGVHDHFAEIAAANDARAKAKTQKKGAEK